VRDFFERRRGRERALEQKLLELRLMSPWPDSPSWLRWRISRYQTARKAYSFLSDELHKKFADFEVEVERKKNDCMGKRLQLQLVEAKINMTGCVALLEALGKLQCEFKDLSTELRHLNCELDHMKRLKLEGRSFLEGGWAMPRFDFHLLVYLARGQSGCIEEDEEEDEVLASQYHEALLEAVAEEEKARANAAARTKGAAEKEEEEEEEEEEEGNTTTKKLERYLLKPPSTWAEYNNGVRGRFRERITIPDWLTNKLQTFQEELRRDYFVMNDREKEEAMKRQLPADCFVSE